jgi:hypothetical protein
VRLKFIAANGYPLAAVVGNHRRHPSAREVYNETLVQVDE